MSNSTVLFIAYSSKLTMELQPGSDTITKGVWMVANCLMYKLSLLPSLHYWDY